VGSLGHFVDLLPVVVQTTATSAQARLLELQIHHAQEHSHGGVGKDGGTLRRYGQLEQVGRSALGFDLAH
jgi:hypothetical protein